MTKQREVLKVHYDVQDWWTEGGDATPNGIWVHRSAFSGFSNVSDARKGARQLRKRIGKGARTRIVKTTREVVEVSK